MHSRAESGREVIMNSTRDVEGTVTTNETKQDLKSQLAEYIAEQPKNIQALHRRLERLELVSLGLIVPAFVVAVYVTVNRTRIEETTIAAAWLAVPASVTPSIFLVGLHGVILRAFPPGVFPGEKGALVTGRKAVREGWGYMLAAVIGAAFLGLPAYVLLSRNLAAVDILANVVGVVIAAAVIASLYQRLVRSR
jgi:hypothetical protein